MAKNYAYIERKSGPEEVWGWEQWLWETENLSMETVARMQPVPPNTKNKQKGPAILKEAPGQDAQRQHPTNTTIPQHMENCP